MNWQKTPNKAKRHVGHDKRIFFSADYSLYKNIKIIHHCDSLKYNRPPVRKPLVRQCFVCAVNVLGLLLILVVQSILLRGLKGLERISSKQTQGVNWCI